MSTYTSSEYVMSSYVGLEVRKYEKTPHNWRGILSLISWKHIEWSLTVGLSSWILGVSYTIIPASRIMKGGIRFLPWRWRASQYGWLICRSSCCGGSRTVLMHPILEYFSSCSQVRRHWLLQRYLSQRVCISSSQILACWRESQPLSWSLILAFPRLRHCQSFWLCLVH